MYVLVWYKATDLLDTFCSAISNKNQAKAISTLSSIRHSELYTLQKIKEICFNDE